MSTLISFLEFQHSLLAKRSVPPWLHLYKSLQNYLCPPGDWIYICNLFNSFGTQILLASHNIIIIWDELYLENEFILVLLHSCVWDQYRLQYRKLEPTHGKPHVWHFKEASFKLSIPNTSLFTARPSTNLGVQNWSPNDSILIHEHTSDFYQNTLPFL